MKKRYYLSAVLCLAIGTAQAQSMSENFDGWTVGSYMGTNSASWSTWSGTTGGAEDVQVTSAQAASGANSIYFQSTSANGGPQDVIVGFGGQHNTGHFNMDANFFVESNKGAYFNYQANTTVGQVWSFNCQMHNNGNITFDDGASVWLTTTYPQNQWFNLEIDVDLNTNSWNILIDGNSVGLFQAVTGQIASIDIFPVNSANGGNNQAGFYVDDFNYTVTPFALPTENGAVSFIDDITGLAGMDKNPIVTVRNLGTTPITSFDLAVDYDGNQITETITGVNIASMGTYDVTFSGAITLVGGSNPVVATISNVNGNGADNNAADDSKTIYVDPVVPAAGKVVVGEEGTGTWCQWCPRGAVYMDYMETKYADYWAGIAVHNGDPMTNVDYDAGIGGLIGGYPSALVDRGADIDPSAIEADFLQQIVIDPSAYITPGAIYDSGTGELQISITTQFVNTVTGNWKIACVVTEDGVTGTSGYSQSNAYAGGANGPMGGYESLPNPVPASQMVYDHVAREIMPSFAGQNPGFPSMNAGETYAVNFTVQIDPSWDDTKLHIIGLLIKPDGKIDNAGKATLSEAEMNGFEEAWNVGTVEYDFEKNISMYPNPANQSTTLYISGLENDEVMVKVFDINGKLVMNQNLGQLSGSTTVNINTDQFQAGMYTVQTIVGDTQKIEKLIVE